MASEGIIITKNDGGLSLSGVTNLNVFGWTSGKTVDTWLRDVTLAPTYNNIGHFACDNVDNKIFAPDFGKKK